MSPSVAVGSSNAGLLSARKHNRWCGGLSRFPPSRPTPVAPVVTLRIARIVQQSGSNRQILDVPFERDPEVGKQSAQPRTWGDRARRFKASLHRLRVDATRADTHPKAIPWMEALARAADRMLAQVEAIPKAQPLPGRKAGITCSNAGCTRTVWVGADHLFMSPKLRLRCEACATPKSETPAPLRPASRDERLETAVTLGLGYPMGPLAMGDRWGGASILEVLFFLL